MVEPRGVPLAHGVCRGKKPEMRVRVDHLVLLQQRELPVTLQQPLDDEHHVRASGIVFVEQQRNGPAQRPRQDPFLKGRDLLSVADADAILAHQVQPADVPVQIHAHAGPVQPRRHLLDVGGFARAVQPLYQHPPVVLKPCQQRKRHRRVEVVVRIDGRHERGGRGKGIDHQTGVQAEALAHGHALACRAGRRQKGVGVGGHGKRLLMW